MVLCWQNWELFWGTFSTQGLCSLWGVCGGWEGTYPCGVHSLLKRPARLVFFSGRCLSDSHWDCPGPSYRAWAAHSWEPHTRESHTSPLSVHWWKWHKLPSFSLRKIAFCSALEKLFFICFRSGLWMRLPFVFHAFLFCTHTCMYVFI